MLEGYRTQKKKDKKARERDLNEGRNGREIQKGKPFFYFLLLMIHSIT